MEKGALSTASSPEEVAVAASHTAAASDGSRRNDGDMAAATAWAGVTPGA